MPWTKFSQDGLKQLSAKDPKIEPLVEPFIEIPASERPPRPEIKIQDVTRLELPPKQSLIGALFSSSVGLVALLLIYAANIYAGFEAVFRVRPIGLGMGVAAVLPVLGPVIFLSLPIVRLKPRRPTPVKGEEQKFSVPGMAANGEINIVAASWQEPGTPALRRRRFSSADSSRSTAGFSRRSSPDFSASSAATLTRTWCWS